ncbi:phosphotransferase system enzyme I (PtsI) [Methylohalomonas lacus]|uniref:Phosphoenolpyruvate-protein phosphotransferase n=1 Tax=Methylohalomonas lacus TaxID=398773 RepID=A0AAE3HKV8_9GAMM|nr:phosphoenolpyruvate--protein phosphotransferase [Methylohalomonas lacus]MCS3904215.1 phosphotransferase system enzyme I (PtsI) [Methylohalomonas lacus]
MSFALHGVGVSRGIAIGNVHIIERNQLEIPEYNITPDDVEAEVKRFESAISSARQQLRAIRNHVPREVGSDIAAFIDTHLLMLEDVAITEEPGKLIRDMQCNAEWALRMQRDALVNVFEEMDDAYLRTRKDDVVHVINRIQRILLKHTPLRHEEPDSRLSGYIVLADDLTPADTVLLQYQGIVAFATEFGGPTSHTAILARSLGIPAIVGVHQARRYVREDEQLVIDGTRGVLLANPDKRTLNHYKRRQREEKRYLTDLKKIRLAPTVSQDGVTIDLQTNIELPRDFENVREVGASGVGLYRTEFMYMNRETPPDEEEHYETYASVIRILDGLPLTIRTLDLGADKQVDGGRQSGPVQSNPALGLRAIRLCLKEPALFRPQVRAIMRASALGPVRMMIPMLSNVHEMEQVLQMVTELKQELSDKRIPFDHDIAVGGMIEVPAAAVCADIFAKHLDFLSIGTNDLIQYTMAIDRVNEEVNYLYDPLHPAVLRLVHQTLQAGERAGIPVAMCGEMAGETEYTRLLLGLGLREFSVHPAVLLEVKQIVMHSRIRDLEKLARKALQACSGGDVLQLMQS